MEAMERGHQERLPVMVAELFEAANLKPSDLTDIGVTLGPGSFTGVRVGLAFAKGVSVALGLKLKGIGTLEALGRHNDLHDEARLSVIDGGRGRIYVQRFLPYDQDEALVITSESDLAALGQVDVLTGPAAKLLAEKLPDAWVYEQNNPVTGSLYYLTLAPGHDDVTPLYMRDADAVASTRGIISLGA